MSKDIEAIKKEIDEIKKRNKRVETDKAWETSALRKIFILFTTYVLVVLILVFANNDRPFVNAIIPALGYLLSTASLGLFKNYWLKSRKRV